MSIMPATQIIFCRRRAQRHCREIFRYFNDC